MSHQEHFGSFNGFPIKKKCPEDLISLTDLHKSCGSPPSLRTDKWLRTEEVQAKLQTLSGEVKKGVEVDKSGLILQIEGYLEIIRGGARQSQGTFASFSLASFYASALSDECYQWLSDLNSDLSKDSEVIKAKRVSVYLGSIELSVFQLPDGSYRLSQTEVAGVLEIDEINFRRFLGSNLPESLPYKGFKFDKVRDKDSRGRPANGVPVPLAVAFWISQAIDGSQKAIRLLGASSVESIEIRADKAFGLKRTDEDRNQRFESSFKSVIASYPETFALSQSRSNLKVSVYGASKRQINKIYPNGVIKGLHKKDALMKEIIYLSSHTTYDYWKLTPGLELSCELGTLTRTKYPDALTGIIPVNSKNEKAVFIFQFFPRVVDSQDIEDCALKRQYVQVAKKAMGVDYAFLFCVSPLGATSEAMAMIEDRLPSGENGCEGYVGVLTVKELAQFYTAQIESTRTTALGRGRISKPFKRLLDYEIRTNPLQALTDSKCQQLNLFE